MEGEQPRTGESDKERLQRNLGELLQELRVAQTGVQVLFAFLLTVPFSSRFEQLTGLQRGAYFAALMSAALAGVLLIAPSSLHRLLFRHGERAFLVTVANRLTIIGLAFVALSMTAALLLVSDVMFGSAIAITIAALIAVAFAGIWYAIPLVRRRHAMRPPD